MGRALGHRGAGALTAATIPEARRVVRATWVDLPVADEVVYAEAIRALGHGGDGGPLTNAAAGAVVRLVAAQREAGR